ncbi:hypothetical protein F511_40827 [Dorcoceras hygrometricum]|uniref:Uncharacterized protein n=1 Tax=Dorcoceras hygrometricum TaxID=472368 RepID=A0A2Z7AFD9_9LAMI|nr:hypothetical protein F511_40827 [Dorcoceras hygrometricum]
MNIWCKDICKFTCIFISWKQEAMKRSAGAGSYSDQHMKIQQMRRNALDLESAVMTSALMSSQSAGSNQQMKRSEKDEATSCWRISRWISVDDVIGDVISFSRWLERAVARISRTGFSLDELSGCASLGQMPSFYFRCAERRRISRKKHIAQRREAAKSVQQLVQYKDSAVGLVFMESAVGLNLETSKVESAVRNQVEAKLNQLEHDEPAETMTTSCKR